MKKLFFTLIIICLVLSVKADFTPQINGDTLYCMNAPIQLYVSNDSGAINESWIIQNVNTNAFVFVGEGDTINLSLSFVANYEVILISQYPEFSIFTYFGFRVINSPAITLTADYTTVACSDTFVTLLPSGGSFYFLYNQSQLLDSGVIFHVNSTGNYYVTGSDGTCTGGSSEIPVTFETPPDAVCVANHFPVLGDTLEENSIDICGGLVSLQWEITFQPNENVTDYAAYWSNGSTSINSGLVSPGEYACRITSSNGCVYKMDTVSVNLVPLDKPRIRVTGTSQAPVLKVKTKSYTIDSYQWYSGNNAIPGATDSTYAPLVTGKYSVEVTSGICSVKSRVVKIIIGEKLAAGTAAGVTDEIIAYQILNITGQFIGNNARDLSPGIYIVRALYSDHSVQVRKWNYQPGSNNSMEQLFSK